MRFCRSMSLLAAVFGFLIAPAFVYAQEADGTVITEQSAAISEHEEASQGLPQFDFSMFPEQIFWLVASFFLLYLAMHFLAVPRIAKTQDNRKKVITTSLETAKKANEDAKIAAITANTHLREAREKSKEKLSNMITALDEEEDNKRQSKEKEVLKRVRRAENKIEVDKTKALNAVAATAEEISEEIVQKIFRSSVKVG